MHIGVDNSGVIIYDVNDRCGSDDSVGGNDDGVSTTVRETAMVMSEIMVKMLASVTPVAVK